MTVKVSPLAFSRRYLKLLLTHGVIWLGLTICVVGLWRLLAGSKLQISLSLTSQLMVSALALGSTFLSAASWRYFLYGTSGALIPWRVAFAQNALVLMGKYVPGKVAGIAARVATNSTVARPAEVVLASVYEAAYSLIVSGLAGVSLYFVAINWKMSPLTVALGVLGTVVLPAVFSSTLFRSAALARRLGFNSFDEISPVRSHIHAGALYVWAQWGLLFALTAVVASSVAPSVELKVLASIAGSYGIAVAAGTLAVVFPGGIGPREGVFVWLASPQVGLDSAVALALLLRIVTVGIDLVGAAGYVFTRTKPAS